MTILDIFKRKKITKTTAKKKKVGKKQRKGILNTLPRETELAKKSSRSPKRKREIGVKQVSKTAPSSIKKKEFFAAYKSLKSPHITEKATALVKANQYIFRVWPRANKTEIKKAVESLYKVDAVSAKIINVPSKKRRLGKIEGIRKGYKKAIVKIKEGQKIEILPR